MWSQGWEAVAEREVPVSSGSDALQESDQLPSVPTTCSRLKDPLKAGPCDAVPHGPSSDTISALVITLFRFPLENSQLVSIKSESLTAYSSPPCSETLSSRENTLLCCFPKQVPYPVNANTAGACGRLPWAPPKTLQDPSSFPTLKGPRTFFLLPEDFSPDSLLTTYHDSQCSRRFSILLVPWPVCIQFALSGSSLAHPTSSYDHPLKHHISNFSQDHITTDRMHGADPKSALFSAGSWVLPEQRGMKC